MADGCFAPARDEGEMKLKIPLMSTERISIWYSERQTSAQSRRASERATQVSKIKLNCSHRLIIFEHIKEYKVRQRIYLVAGSTHRTHIENIVDVRRIEKDRILCLWEKHFAKLKLKLIPKIQTSRTQHWVSMRRCFYKETQAVNIDKRRYCV